jgi:Holliday junction resolvase
MNFQDIKSIEDLEKVSKESIWQNFERLAAFILEENCFQVKIDKVKTFNKKRRQYDVIAKRGNQILLVECKKWSGNRYRLSALKRAIEQHKERTAFYKSITGEDAVPIIVTLVEEDIQFYEGMPIVPIQKLNSFINEMDKYANGNFFGDCKDNMTFPNDTPRPFD